MESYVSLEELEELVSQLYTSNQLDSVVWGGVSNESKLVLINRATSSIDSLLFRGVKVDVNQVLKFPRIIGGINKGVPLGVKLAVSYLAVGYLFDDISPRKKLMKEGVTSIKAGDITENYLVTNETVSSCIDDRVVNMYLKPFIHNGVVE